MGRLWAPGLKADPDSIFSWWSSLASGVICCLSDHQSAANITWWVYWMRNRGLLLPIFCTIFIQVSLLTNSAVVLSAKTQRKQTILEIDSINCGVKWLCWGVQSIVHLNVQIQNMETCVRFIYFPFRWVKCGPFDIGTGDPCDKLIEKPSLIVSIDWVALTSLVGCASIPLPWSWWSWTWCSWTLWT